MRLPGSRIWLLALASLCVAPGGSAQEVVADYSWAREHRDECAEELLGAHEDVSGAPFSDMAVVTVRVLEDGCGERQVSLVAMRGDSLRVHAAQVIGEPILEQLFFLHEAAPDHKALELCRKMPMESRAIEDKAAERFRDSLEQLGENEFSLLPKTFAVVHGVTYSIWITSGQWNVHVSFSETRDPNTRHHLATWADDLLNAAGLTCQPKPPGHGEAAQ